MLYMKEMQPQTSFIATSQYLSDTLLHHLKQQISPTKHTGIVLKNLLNAPLSTKMNMLKSPI